MFCIRLCLLSLAIVGFAVAPTHPATAQSLPDWAAPAPPPAASSSSGIPPDPPGTPAQEVPLDGGLALLALAGGAYAARRLRQKGD